MHNWVNKTEWNRISYLNIMINECLIKLLKNLERKLRPRINNPFVGTSYINTYGIQNHMSAGELIEPENVLRPVRIS